MKEKELIWNLIPTFEGTMQDFEQFVNQNKLVLYSIVYGIAGSFEADDIVQETFLYVYYHYDKLKDKEKVLPWICAIARNKAFDSLKHCAHSVPLDALIPAVSHVTPETILLKQEEKSQLIREINALSEKYRETVLLFYFAGKSIREISEILSIPEGTVKFRLCESRKKLKKELGSMSNEEKSEIIKKDIFTKIKEQTEKAGRAIEERNTKAASDICDAMLHEIGDLSSLTLDELRILWDLYQTKVLAIRFAEGLEAADPYLKKSIEIAEASKDPEWISDTYRSYGCELANMGRLEESGKYHKMALEQSERCGKIGLIADNLYWNGIRSYERNAEDRGLSYFKRVLDMKEALFADKENESLNKLSYALSYSAAVALTRAGDKLCNLDGFYSTVPIIADDGNGLKLNGQPGYSNGNNVLEDIFYRITCLSPCLSDKVKAGYTFEQNTFSFSHQPVRSRYEVVSMNESVTVPAGIFEQCLHTRYTNSMEDDNITNKMTNGITDIWYAPGIGIAAMMFKPIQGEAASMKLKSYEVESCACTSIPERYLPLAASNKWSYETYDSNDVPLSERYDYENLFEAVCIRGCDNAALIAHSGWTCLKEK